MNHFTEIRPADIQDNPFDLIGNQWMLISAGQPEAMNTMTASWGGVGILWNKPVATCYIRPTRHTYAFTEREDTFSLAFLDEAYRPALRLCGTMSGREGDKFAAAGLTPRTDEAAPYPDEARLVLICRKLYQQDMDPAGFADPSLEGHYHNDYHRIYVGEIVKVLRRMDGKE